MRHRIFLLSPASLAGKRAGLLLDDGSELPLARALRSGDGVPLAEVFAFASALYFRGKRAYARTFASPPEGKAGVWVITTDRGLVPAETPVGVQILREMARGTIDPEDPRYAEPLVATAREVLSGSSALEAVLLGSIATDKYLAPLLPVFGPRLRFPAAFVGRGDMSRGGLLLRCVEEDRELEYVVARGAERTGERPPRLDSRVGRPGGAGEEEG